MKLRKGKVVYTVFTFLFFCGLTFLARPSEQVFSSNYTFGVLMPQK